MPERTVFENGALRLAGEFALRPLRDGSFLGGPTRFSFKLGKDSKPTSLEATNGEAVRRLVAEAEWSPTPDELKSVAGVWRSDEADASFTIAVEGGQAFFVQRSATRQLLRPQYKDHFTIGRGSGQVIWVTRDSGGRITKLHVGASRMRDMPFERVGSK